MRLSYGFIEHESSPGHASPGEAFNVAPPRLPGPSSPSHAGTPTPEDRLTSNRPTSIRGQHRRHWPTPRTSRSWTATPTQAKMRWTWVPTERLLSVGRTRPLASSAHRVRRLPHQLTMGPHARSPHRRPPRGAAQFFIGVSGAWDSKDRPLRGSRPRCGSRPGAYVAKVRFFPGDVASSALEALPHAAVTHHPTPPKNARPCAGTLTTLT